MIKVFGNDCNGQLGLNSNGNNSNPTNLVCDEQLQAIRCGANFTILCKFNGKLFSMGDNSKAQLGLGDNSTNIKRPQLIKGIEGFVDSIFCGADHTFVITYEKKFYCFGKNEKGQLGIGTNVNQNQPFECNFDLGEIQTMSCGGDHTLLLTKANKLYSFGENSDGQLGIANTGPQNKPVFMREGGIKMICCGKNFSLILEKKGDLLIFGKHDRKDLGNLENYFDDTVPKKLYFDPTIRMISCGSDHFLLLNTSGKVSVFGQNSCGQLGTSNTSPLNKVTELMLDPKIVSIRCGAQHSMILKDNAEILVFGNNSNGQLGTGNSSNLCSPTKIGPFPTISIFLSGGRDFNWRPEKHLYLSKDFQQMVFILVVACTRFGKRNNLKIPKYILFSIINELYWENKLNN